MTFVRNFFFGFGAIAILLGVISLALRQVPWAAIQILGGAAIMIFAHRYKSSS